MITDDRVRFQLNTAVSGASSALTAADRLCRVCVELLEVDGASISLTLDGTTRGTFAASGELSRRLDALQFTAGHGPCLDAVSSGRPVLVPDLGDPQEVRWPGFTGAVLDAGIRAVFALPVSLSRQPVGALDLYRRRPGPLGASSLSGGLLAAELAALPLLDVIAEHRTAVAADAASVETPEHGPDGDAWSRLSSLEQVEVYQATGMIMGALDVDAAEALVRLRAQAFLRGLTAADLAWEIVERRVCVDSAEWSDRDDPDGLPR